MGRYAVWTMLAALLAMPAQGHASELGGVTWTVSFTPEYTPSPWTKEIGYSHRALAKFGFGLQNLLLGWTELITEPGEALQENNSFLVGVGTGIKHGVLQTLGGAVHLATFLVTELDAPLPEGGVQFF